MRAGGGVVVGGVERRGWLAGDVEPPLAIRGALRAAAEGRDQVLGEEVLVDVGAHAGWHIATKSTGLVGKGGQLRIEGKVRVPRRSLEAEKPLHFRRAELTE